MIFQSARLIARRFGPQDLGSFVAMRSDPEVARYQGWPNYTEADGRRFLAEIAGRRPGKPGWFQFALEDKATGAFVGDCGLDMLDETQLQARIGYTIAAGFWNQGLATEAVMALAAYCFGTFPVHRISASLDPRNAASCRVLGKAGFVRAGQFRESAWFSGEWAEDDHYVLTRG